MEDSILHKCSSDSTFEYIFFCEGCGNCHGFRTATWPQPTGMTEQEIEWFKSKWNFNDDNKKPTISPSLLIHDINEKGEQFVKCHSFITDGKIQYLGDCNHKLAGQTIDLKIF
jgi:hypothetical protein